MGQSDKIKELKKELTITFVKMLREKDLYILFMTNDEWKQNFISSLNQAIEGMIRYSMRVGIVCLPTDSLFGCGETTIRKIVPELKKRGIDIGTRVGMRNFRQCYLNKLKLNDDALNTIDDILSNGLVGTAFANILESKNIFVNSKTYFEYILEGM